jgi:hypothetical protein
MTNNQEFNAWFLGLPETDQGTLVSDKWMLAEAAFAAGKKIGPFKKRERLEYRVLDFLKDPGLKRGDSTPKCLYGAYGGRVIGKQWPWVSRVSRNVTAHNVCSVWFSKTKPD